jgi:hypothetical protein
MNEIVKKANRIKFETIIKNLEKRNIEGYYCDTPKEACEKAMSLIKDGSSVSWGGSVTIREIGLLNMLEARNLKLIDAFRPASPTEAYEHFRQTLLTDYFLMSTNSITLDGKLVNIDGTGNRMAAFILGPREVIIFAGANKIAESEEDAVARIKAHACPSNAARLNKEKTPCAVVGKCGDCITQECMCSHTVITRFSRMPGRIKVLLINENLGF